MAVNIDSAVNNVRSVLRGEVTGSIRFLSVMLLTLAVWVGVYITAGWYSQGAVNLTSQQSRWRTLLILADEYRSISPASGSSISSNANRNIDVPTVFTQVSENMGLGSRVNRISPDGRNQSVEINRLYADELAELERQLASRGVRFIAAEIRAMPSGNERLFTVSAIIGPMN